MTFWHIYIYRGVLERDELSVIEWDLYIGKKIQPYFLYNNLYLVGYLLLFSLCLFLVYIITPVLLRIESATLFNLSLLTSDVYAIFIGVFLFQQKLNIFYFLALFLIGVGLVIYNHQPLIPSSNHSHSQNKHSLEKQLLNQ